MTQSKFKKFKIAMSRRVGMAGMVSAWRNSHDRKMRTRWLHENLALAGVLF